MENEYILQAKDVVKTFHGTKALSGVRLEVRPGEIHALVGENGAGKSTLMNIIDGVFPADSGEILWQGERVRFRDPQEAMEHGIGFVHQELAMCQQLTVAENIFIGRLPKKELGLVDAKKLRHDAKECLSRFKVVIDPDELVSGLTTAEQQVVEIARAISANCKLIIFDEPTSSLTDRESETLFEIIRDLKASGVSVLYISHRMSEIFSLCDRITVFRDGCYVDTKKTSETNVQQIVSSMVGREIQKFYPPKSAHVGEVILEVKGYSRAGAFDDISFTVRKGEILGMSGLIGAGRTEVVRAVCAIDPCDAGELVYEGKALHLTNYYTAIRSGIGYLSEDRKRDGLFVNLSVLQNISAAKLENVSNGALVSGAKEQTLAERYIRQLNIKVSDVQQSISSLSGGNQQKVMLAKWLGTEPAVLFLDEPTRGIDVGAKVEIYNQLRALSDAGVGIVVISSDLPEIIGLCDRAVVMSEGKKTGEVVGEQINEKKIMMLASMQVEHSVNERPITAEEEGRLS